MVGYVLLVVIAVGLSVAVFSFLKIYVPKEKPECSPDINLIVQSIEKCTINGNKISLDNLKLTNKGLFKIPATFIRLAPESKRIREQINPDIKDFYLANYDLATGEGGLDPGKTETFLRLVTDRVKNHVNGSDFPSPGDYTIEIQPATISDEFPDPIACTNAVITQPVKCVGTP